MEHNHMLPQQHPAMGQISRSHPHQRREYHSLSPAPTDSTSSPAPSLNAISPSTMQNSPPAQQLPPLNLSLPPIQPPHEKPAAGSGQTLPSLSSLTGAQPAHFTSLPPSSSTPAAAGAAPSPSTAATPSPTPTQHWPSLNPFTAYYAPSHVQNPEPPMRKDYVNGQSHQRATSVSLDDPGVRAAAEALGRLRTGEF